VSFFNTLDQDQKISRDITSATGKNSDGTVNRNTISWTSGSADSLRTDRAVNYLSWMDGCAIADWAGLRPMTELEFEKAARGIGVSAASGEYVWGNTTLAAAAAISGAENGTETVSTEDANAHYGNASLSGGDGSQGPLRAGIFAKSDTTRTQAGAGFYGVMELAGNIAEHVVSVGNTAGRLFQGTHGDGELSDASNYEGNATNTDWPGADAVADRGVTGASGSGLRGGSWADADTKLRTSDRSGASTNDSSRSSQYGFRAVRTAP